MITSKYTAKRKGTNNIRFYVHQVWLFWIMQEELEDARGVIRIRISKKNRQHNG